MKAGMDVGIFLATILAMATASFAQNNTAALVSGLTGAATGITAMGISVYQQQRNAEFQREQADRLRRWQDSQREPGRSVAGCLDGYQPVITIHRDGSRTIRCERP